MEPESEKLETMFHKIIKISTVVNFVMFGIFSYITFQKASDFNLILVLVTVIISFILTIIAFWIKTKAIFRAFALLPFLITLLGAILLFSGVWVYIAMFFGYAPFAPN